MHEATPGECTLCDRSCRYSIQNDFFCRLAGPVAPTGKAIVHWIGCINAIKMVFILFERKIFVVSIALCLIKIHWVVPEI